ncbi:hypothetical protein EIZ62_23470 [Streptomyces ficellus]|uniref:DUF3558 domain-containing protein n=1 Tax=Streptomyces ficellus TaxID=1977088 RepID=A0A6I6FGL2_9ACTN|nr:hypothetical protein EIZ62_23470 [Streptomyces ficellus]
MRKAKAAVAAGVVLLVAGCGGGGTDTTTGEAAPSSAASAPAGGAGAEAGGGLDAAAVTKEISAAATAAGFTEEPSDEDVPPALKPCMVSWQVDDKKAGDSKKSYDATLAALTEGGWKQSQKFDQKGSVITSLDKSGWTMKASHHGQGGFLVVSFIATDNGPKCEKLFQQDLEKNKTAQ